jgi:hypothetical protein
MEKNEMILKILKRPLKISKYVSFIKDTVLNDSKSPPLKENLLEEGYAFEDINSIEISDHAELRWNTRVGPRTTSKQLKRIFNQLLHNTHRLKKLDESFGVIDSDIIFTYEKSGDTLIVTTFYGRRTINHSLYQIKALRGYNSFNNDQLMLEFEENVLNKQKMPSIPMTFMEFDGIKTKYFLEGYRITDEEFPVFFVHCIPGEVVEINLNKVPDMHINKSIMLVLFLMRYRDFVWKYLRINFKDRVERLINKYNL